MRAQAFASLVLSASLVFGLAPSEVSADAPVIVELERASAEAERGARRLYDLLDQTRLAGPTGAVRARCVDERLSQVHAFYRMLNDRIERLREALALGHRERAAHELSVARRMVAQLRAVEMEGRACVHPAARIRRGGTEVVVTIERDTPNIDPSVYGSPRVEERPRRF